MISRFCRLELLQLSYCSIITPVLIKCYDLMLHTEKLGLLDCSRFLQIETHIVKFTSDVIVTLLNRLMRMKKKRMKVLNLILMPAQLSFSPVIRI